MSSPPEFFYFDLGKVLLDFDHGIACRQLAELLVTTEDVIQRDVFVSGQQWKYERGEIDTPQFHQWLCERYEIEPSIEDVVYAASAIFQPMPEVIEIAQRLNEAGHRMGILSNTCDAHWQYCLDRPYSFLDELFSVHALSFRLGCAKPESAIYEKAAQLCEADPKNVFFVDDRSENVEGAVSAGYDAILFQDAAQLRAELHVRGVHL
ncbi:HAD family phosphatase [Bremerella cremea]|uniref:HAD family hydrolase n=1 Tax=Bremerella cremea TaxID=1031537 RepID=UPI0031E9BEF6